MLRRLLDRPVAVIAVTLVLMVLGAVSGRLLPVSLVPDVDAPYVTVRIPAPGLSARQLEETVVGPLRQHLVQLSQLVDLRSEAREEGAVVRLAFEPGADIDYLAIEVNERIDRAMPALPRDLERPRAIKASVTDIPAFYLNLTVRDDPPLRADDASQSVSERFVALSRFAAQVVVRRIEQLPEVALVDLSGTVAQELLVIPDETKLRQAGIGIAEIEQALKKADATLGSLTIRDGEYRYDVRFRQAVGSCEEVRDLFLNIHGRLFRLGELARVVERPRPRQGLVLSDGRDAVTMAIVKQSDARMSDLRNRLDALLRQFRNDYPDVAFTLTRDQTRLLDYSISNLLHNLIAGALLACLVILLFMRDLKSPLLVILTVPVTLVVSLLVFYLAGLSINIVSLSGLVLGIGMMVDHSIIVVDSITARWMRGGELAGAIVGAVDEVRAPMLSSVLTTCAVFVPLIFVDGMAGALFYEQAMAICITLLVAYVISLTLLPVCYRRWYRGQAAFRPAAWLRPFAFERISGAYEAVLNRLFRHRRIVWWTYGLSLVGLAALFALLDKERLPALTYDDLLVRIDWNERISAAENGRRTQALVGLVGDRIVQSTVLAGVQQFALARSEEQSVSEAAIYLKCRTAADVESVRRTIGQHLAASAPRVRCRFGAAGNLFDLIFAGREARLTARLRPIAGRSVDPVELGEAVARIREALPALEVPPPTTREEVLYIARPERMALYGVTYGDLIAVLRNALNENRLFSISSGAESLPVVLGSDLHDPERLFEATCIRTPEAEIPVRALMRRTRTCDLECFVAGAEGGYHPLDLSPRSGEVPAVMAAIRRCIAEDGRFEVSFSGSYFSDRGRIYRLAGVLAIALALLWLILAAQFESLVQPWIILSEIVIDLFGALAVLAVCGQTLNLMSMIGAVVVCGIVVNDSILKIDTINRLRQQGRGLRRAVVEAGQRRLKAIVMTSLTTVLAVVPLLSRGDVGSDLQFPLSLVLIAGLVVGTLVSLFFVPLAYYELYKSRR